MRMEKGTDLHWNLAVPSTESSSWFAWQTSLRSVKMFIVAAKQIT